MRWVAVTLLLVLAASAAYGVDVWTLYRRIGSGEGSGPSVGVVSGGGGGGGSSLWDTMVWDTDDWG